MKETNLLLIIIFFLLLGVSSFCISVCANLKIFELFVIIFPLIGVILFVYSLIKHLSSS